MKLDQAPAKLPQDIDELHLLQDHRTLLKTPVAVGKEISTVAGGEMWYQGIKQCLCHHFRSTTPSVDVLGINLFVDGLPLHNSGPPQCWPIMMQLRDQPDVPIVVLGPDNVDDYLRPLVVDLNEVIENGVMINQKRFGVSLKAIIADTPARAFIIGVAGHNARHGCIQCEIVGKYCKKKNTKDVLRRRRCRMDGCRIQKWTVHYRTSKTIDTAFRFKRARYNQLNINSRRTSSVSHRDNEKNHERIHSWNISTVSK
uniref:Uncharacterized protein n=1 Tax=Anopheles christyi TaxID=43041 RepID=A0A182K6T0_9DIPT